jgi:hypothetical protein
MDGVMAKLPDVDDAAGAIDMDKDWVLVTLLESCTATVKGELLALKGVPVIAPVDAVSVSPDGNAPETTLQVYGSVPPVAVNVAL